MGVVAASRLVMRADGFNRRRLVNNLIDGLLTAVSEVTCAFSAVGAISLMDRACWSNCLATSAISSLIYWVVPEQSLSRI